MKRTKAVQRVRRLTSLGPQLAFLGLMFLPSVERFLARQVVVELTKLTEPTRKSPTGPAVTFCPYNQSR